MGLKKLNLAVMISGRGSNLQALIDACAGPAFPAEILLVIADDPEAQGLQRARDAGIRAVIVDRRAFAGKKDFEAGLQDALESAPVDLICLAGFMRILSPEFVTRWERRMINIHPSLLPEYKGLNTHERVLADGKKQTGCTVHFVVPEMDAGPVIIQKTVPVEPGDTPEKLAARVLVQEHLAYPEAVRLLASSWLSLSI